MILSFQNLIYLLPVFTVLLLTDTLMYSVLKCYIYIYIYIHNILLYTLCIIFAL